MHRISNARQGCGASRLSPHSPARKLCRPSHSALHESLYACCPTSFSVCLSSSLPVFNVLAFLSLLLSSALSLKGYPDVRLSGSRSIVNIPDIRTCMLTVVVCCSADTSSESVRRLMLQDCQLHLHRVHLAWLRAFRRVCRDFRTMRLRSQGAGFTAEGLEFGIYDGLGNRVSNLRDTLKASEST